MNHYSYEVISKEKVRNLQNEGMQSQSYYRHISPKLKLWRSLPKLIFAFLVVLSLLGLLAR